MMAPRAHSGVYHFFITLPDRLYPFGNEIQGQWVRGVRSYNLALARAFKRYGRGHYGYGLTFYRQCFHLIGSLFIIYLATIIAYTFIGSVAALAVLLVLATAGISYQEFILQRRVYRQLWRKGITDWLVWCIPMGIYLFFFK